MLFIYLKNKANCFHFDCANRTVYKKVGHGKKILVNARYMRVPFTEAYLTFPFKKELSFSSFYNHKSNSI